MRTLTRADRLLAEGKGVAYIAGSWASLEQTHYRWRNQFGGSKGDNVEKFEGTGEETATPKRLLADAELEKGKRREIASGRPRNDPTRRGNADSAPINHVFQRRVKPG